MTIATHPAKLIRRLLLVVAMVVATLSTVLVAPTMAQTGDSYEFETGQSLTWSGDWELDGELTFAEDGLESVTIFQGVSFLSALSLPNDFDMDEARDIYLESFLEGADESATIDRGSYGSVSYSLDQLKLDDFNFGAFTLFRAGSGNTPTFAYVFVSEVSVFASQFSNAQSDVLLDGAGLFDGVDGQGLQDQLVAGSGTTPADEGDDADVTPEPDAPEDDADVTPEADEPDDPNPGGLKGGSSSNDDEDDPAPTDDEDPVEDEDPAQSGETGLLDDYTFVSPQYGVELTWGETWQLNDGVDSPVTSNTEAGSDSVSLVPVTGGALLSVSFLDGAELTVEGMVDAWASDEFIANTSISADAEVLLSDSSSEIGAVVVRDFLDDGTEIIVIREAQLVGDALVLIQFNSIPENAEVIVPNINNEILVDGETVLEFFTIDEVLAEFE